MLPGSSAGPCPLRELADRDRATCISAGRRNFRDRLCQLIRQHKRDPELVKAYAVDWCATKPLREATRYRKTLNFCLLTRDFSTATTHAGKRRHTDGVVQDHIRGREQIRRLSIVRIVTFVITAEKCRLFKLLCGGAMKKRNGFSLIELLIVVAIILIIAAIAIPNLLRARIAANESSAVASIRTINTAQISYNSAYPTVGFASSLGALAGTSCTPPSSTSACLIDTQLASGTKSGYSFSAVGSGGPPSGSYEVVAAPLTPNQTGVRYFCSFADAVVRYSTAALTTSSCTYSVSPLQ